MNKITYQEARNTILDAYFREEVNPYDNEFCICGNLSADNEWRNRASHFFHPKRYFYTVAQYLRIEEQLLCGIRDYLGLYGDMWAPTDKRGVAIDPWKHSKFEDALFYGITLALAVIRKIHKYRGENVDAVESKRIFSQRKICQLNGLD